MAAIKYRLEEMTRNKFVIMSHSATDRSVIVKGFNDRLMFKNTGGIYFRGRVKEIMRTDFASQ